MKNKIFSIYVKNISIYFTIVLFMLSFIKITKAILNAAIKDQSDLTNFQIDYRDKTNQNEYCFEAITNANYFFNVCSKTNNNQKYNIDKDYATFKYLVINKFHYPATDNPESCVDKGVYIWTANSDGAVRIIKNEFDQCLTYRNISNSHISNFFKNCSVQEILDSQIFFLIDKGSQDQKMVLVYAMLLDTDSNTQASNLSSIDSVIVYKDEVDSLGFYVKMAKHSNYFSAYLPIYHNYKVKLNINSCYYLHEMFVANLDTRKRYDDPYDYNLVFKVKKASNNKLPINYSYNIINTGYRKSEIFAVHFYFLSLDICVFPFIIICINKLQLTNYKMGTYEIHQPGYSDSLKSIKIDCTYREYSFILQVDESNFKDSIYSSNLKPIHSLSEFYTNKYYNIGATGDLYKIPEINCPDGLLNYFYIGGMGSDKLKQMQTQYRCINTSNIGTCRKTEIIYSENGRCNYDIDNEFRDEHEFRCDTDCLFNTWFSCADDEAIQSIKFKPGNDVSYKSISIWAIKTNNIGIQLTCCKVDIAATHFKLYDSTKNRYCLYSTYFYYYDNSKSALQKILFYTSIEADSFGKHALLR